MPIFSFLSLQTALPRMAFLALHPSITALISSLVTPIVVEPATCAPALPALIEITAATAIAATIRIPIPLRIVVVIFSLLFYLSAFLRRREQQPCQRRNATIRFVG